MVPFENRRGATFLVVSTGSAERCRLRFSWCANRLRDWLGITGPLPRPNHPKGTM